MTASRKSPAIPALLLALPLAVTPFALQAAKVTGNVSLATDYVFRGFSQTDEKAAIQGGFDVTFERGFYVGIWGSNVDFGPDFDASIEIDYYGGWSGDIADGVTLDANVAWYSYPGEADADYPEYGVSLTWRDATLGLVYSNDYFGDDGPDYFYPYLGYELGLPQAFGLNFHVGYNTTDEDDFFADGKKRYTDWSIGLTRQWAGIDFALTYYDTNIDDIEEADARVVFSLSKTL